MGVLRYLFVFACFIIVTVNLIPNDDSIKPLQGLLLSFDQAALRSRYGDTRSLDHRATRSVYHQVLSEAQNAMQNSKDAYEQKALTCSLMRSEARRYARSRDGSYKGHLTDAVLQLRDSYVHGLRYIPVAVHKDIQQSLSLQKPTMYHTGLVIKEWFSCLAPALSSGRCPSYTFLREVRGKSDDEILNSCTVTNSAYDAL